MIKRFSKYIFFSLCLLFASYDAAFSQLSWNQAARLTGPGTRSYIAVPHSSVFNNVDECMISFWFNVSLGSQDQYTVLFGKPTQDYAIVYDNGIYLRTSGTPGTPDLKADVSVSNNKWHHVSVIIRDTTFIGSDNAKVREIYFNNSIAAKDVRNFNNGTLGNFPDSLYMGCYGAPNFMGELNGYMDEINMWLGKFYPDDVGKCYRGSYSASGNATNPFNKLVLSLTFQDASNSAGPFNVSDRSNYYHNVKNNNVTGYDMGARPSATIFPSQSIHLNGSGDYLAAPDHSNVSLGSTITMEAWIHPEKTYTGAFSDLGTIFCKGLATQEFRMYLGAGNGVYASINGNANFTPSVNAVAPQNQWTHVAFTYNGSNGFYNYYVNGYPAGSGINNQGSLVNGNDSFYVGKSSGQFYFNGYIDEIKIAAYAKSHAQVNDFLYKAMDLNDRPTGLDLTTYNFDGYLENNTGVLPRLSFRNGATFSSNYVGSAKSFTQAPLLKADNYNFPAGWYIANNSFRIPMSGTQGSSQYDTINIPYYLNISDINLFLGINHTYNKDVTVYLVSPSGDSVPMIQNNEMVRGQFTSLYNDQADSNIVNNKYTSFLPQIKPFNSLNATFINKNTRGNWKLRVNDNANGDTGRVYAWGLQFNNMPLKTNVMTLTMAANLVGLWNGTTQQEDTIRFYLRSGSSPYSIIDSGIVSTNEYGFTSTQFINAPNGTYYIEYKHRNSVAVWTKFVQFFSKGSSTSLTLFSDPNIVYGNNLILSEGRYCLYSGDINQDGSVNGNDFTLFSQQFGTGGYLASDLNADNSVNGNDFTLFNQGFGHQTLRP